MDAFDSFEPFSARKRRAAFSVQMIVTRATEACSEMP
jgi:hypothetical protein